MSGEDSDCELVDKAEPLAEEGEEAGADNGENQDATPDMDDIWPQIQDNPAQVEAVWNELLGFCVPVERAQMKLPTNEKLAVNVCKLLAYLPQRSPLWVKVHSKEPIMPSASKAMLIMCILEIVQEVKKEHYSFAWHMKEMRYAFDYLCKLFRDYKPGDYCQSIKEAKSNVFDTMRMEYGSLNEENSLDIFREFFETMRFLKMYDRLLSIFHQYAAVYSRKKADHKSVVVAVEAFEAEITVFASRYQAGDIHLQTLAALIVDLGAIVDIIVDDHGQLSDENHARFAQLISEFTKLRKHDITMDSFNWEHSSSMTERYHKKNQHIFRKKDSLWTWRWLNEEADYRPVRGVVASAIRQIDDAYFTTKSKQIKGHGIFVKGKSLQLFEQSLLGSQFKCASPGTMVHPRLKTHAVSLDAEYTEFVVEAKCPESKKGATPQATKEHYFELDNYAQYMPQVYSQMEAYRKPRGFLFITTQESSVLTGFEDTDRRYETVLQTWKSWNKRCHDPKEVAKMFKMVGAWIDTNARPRQPKLPPGKLPLSADSSLSTRPGPIDKFTTGAKRKRGPVYEVVDTSAPLSPKKKKKQQPTQQLSTLERHKARKQYRYVDSKGERKQGDWQLTLVAKDPEW